MLSCWLAEELRQRSNDERLRLARAYHGVDLLLYLSGNQREIFLDSGFRDEQLALVPFGAGRRSFMRETGRAVPRDVPLLSVGFDRGRDYGTLFEAVSMTDIPLRVYCKPSNLAGVRIPKNAEVHAPVPFEEYWNLLQRAQVVVIPTHDLAYPTGQSVALEASLAGACVVVTGTEPMREYFTHEETALLVPVGDPAEMRKAIQRALASADLRTRLAATAMRRVRQHFTTDNLWSAAVSEMRIRGIGTTSEG